MSSLSNKYNIKACLASVASGQLFTGNKTHLAQRKSKSNSPIVVKESSLDRIFSKKPKEWDAAVLELQQLRGLHHPFLADFYGCWQEKGLLYCEREYLDGATLEATIQNRLLQDRPFLEDHILDWLGQIILALKYLHVKKHIHRNLKANNVFFVVKVDFQQTVVRITDMMTPKVFDESRALMANSAVGGGLAVAGHFAPELIAANVKDRTASDSMRKHATNSYDSKIDVWALGVILYQLMAFKHPFLDENWEKVTQAIKSAKKEPISPQYSGTFSKNLHRLLDRLLTVDPNERPSITTLAEEVATVRMLVPMLYAAQQGDIARITQIAGLIENDMKVLAGKEIELPQEDEEKPINSNTEQEETAADQQSANKVVGDTPLHKAARHNQLEAAKTLLDLGVPVDETNDNGDTPLHCCASAEVAQLLLDRGAKIDARGQQGRTPLHFAVERDNVELVKLLVDAANSPAYLETKEDQMGATALDLAAWLGLVEVADALIDRGANVQAKDNDGDTPLHTAAFAGQAAVAKLLTDRGAQLEARNAPQLGRTPLHTAAENGQVEVVQVLIDRCANVNVMDLQTGSTPLHLACQFGHPQVVRALISSGGADKEARDCCGDRPIHVAASCNQKDVVFELLSHNVNADASDAHGKTPLIIATIEGHADVVDTLIRCGGVDPELHDDEFGNTAMHFAAALGHHDIVQILLKKDSSLANRTNDNRRSKARMPLHLAVLNGRLQVVELLLSSPATDATRTDVNDKTAYMVMKHELADNKEVDDETKEAMIRLFRKFNIRN